MSRRTTKTQPKHKQIRRERDPLPWKYCFLTVVCGLVLLAGFFGAARQHFVSIEYGIKNSSLRKQIEELESEKRSLINARETALAPTEIIKAAKKFGFAKIQNTLEALPSQISKPTIEKMSARKIIDEKSSEHSKTETDKKVEKKIEKSLDTPIKKTKKERRKKKRATKKTLQKLQQSKLKLDDGNTQKNNQH